MRRAGPGVFFLIAMLLILTGCGSPEPVQTGHSHQPTPSTPAAANSGQAEEDEKAPKPVSPAVSIKIGYPTQGASMLPLWVAKDAGLLEKYGLQAEVIYVAGTPRLQEAITSNGIQAGLVGVDAVGKSKAAGHDSVILAAVADRPAVYVYAQKDVNPSDVKASLQGKTMITAAEGSLYDHLAQSFVAGQGLTVGRDVKLLYMGGEGDRTAAFLKGEGAFYVVAPPTSFKMDEMGYQKVYDFSNTEVLLAGIGMTREYYGQHPEVAKAIVAALIEANALIAKDRDLAVKSIMKWTGIDDEDMAVKTYEVNLPTFPKKPLVSDASVQFFLHNSTSEEVKRMKPADLVDNSIVEELDETGWIDSLY
ncbi:ABC transporter substrate-binding protein [Brevibacillus massiliensis]|uniref:ABC transporter substrate-binding protein n=1 Tax=Brevibacillus massiliensis TaxID=1118054 RepID=UPI00037E7491|nr:ABC transporter substrate-binding protein [Brevibacillus massiliensis]